MIEWVTTWALPRQYKPNWCSLLTEKEHGHEAQFLQLDIIPRRGHLPNWGKNSNNQTNLTTNTNNRKTKQNKINYRETKSAKEQGILTPAMWW